MTEKRDEWQRSVSIWYDRDLSLSDTTEICLCLMWQRCDGERWLFRWHLPLFWDRSVSHHIERQSERERERAGESERERERARESEISLDDISPSFEMALSRIRDEWQRSVSIWYDRDLSLSDMAEGWKKDDIDICAFLTWDDREERWKTDLFLSDMTERCKRDGIAICLFLTWDDRDVYFIPLSPRNRGERQRFSFHLTFTANKDLCHLMSERNTWQRKEMK